MFFEDGWQISIIITKTWLFLAMFFAFGTLLYQIVITKPQTIQFKMPLLFFALTAAVANFLLLLLQTGYFADEGLMGMFDFQTMQFFTAGALKYPIISRLLAIIILIFAVLKNGSLLSILAIAATVISMILQNHSTSNAPILASILLAAHYSIIAFWLGALYPLYKLSDQADTPKHAEEFGKIASILVPILVLSGVVLTWLNLGGFAAIFTSQYGQILIIKLVILALLLALAALNKLKLVPLYQIDPKSAAKKLRSSIKLEALCFLTIVFVTIYLTNVIGLPYA